LFVFGKESLPSWYLFMKVLWFTNILLPVACEHLGFSASKGGGWMEALRINIERYYSEVDLHIASFSMSKFDPFRIGNATYYAIEKDKPSGRIKNILKNWKHTRYSDKELQQCIDLVDMCNPNLIHVHGSESLFGLVQETTSIPVVISLQGILMSYQSFSFSGIGVADRLRIERMSEFIKGRGLTHQQIVEMNQARIEERICSNCKFFLGRTEWDKSIALLMNPKASYNTVGEILREPFHTTSWDNSNLRKQIVFATTSSALRKGILVLLDAIGILRRKGFNNINLRLAGSIKKQAIWPLINRHIIKNEIEQSVIFLGSLSAKELAIELSQSSVFVHPSFIDNSPNSLAEAMMIGTPCVATAVGGVPSMLEHNKEGLLCTPGDAFGLAAAIREVFAQEKKSLLFSVNARKKAKRIHDNRSVTLQLLQAYKDISKK